MRLLPLLIAALLLAAGCGGGSALTSGSSADEVAGIVPADTALLIAFETDPESEQWQQADELLSKFPGRQKLADALTKELSGEGLDLEADVLPALGDETYVAVLDVEGGEVVVLTQPRDRAKLDALLRKSEESLVTRDVQGWTAIADSEAALDGFAAPGEKLADAQWFLDAQERVEEEALVTLFANGGAIGAGLSESLPEGCEPPAALGRLEYAAGMFRAEDDGIRLALAAAGDDIQQLAKGESLLSSVPAGAFAYLGAPGFDTSLLDLGAGCEPETPAVPLDPLGVSLEGLSDLFAGGVALSAKRGLLVPEITLLLAPEDEAKAVQLLDDLAESLAEGSDVEIERRQVGDVEARSVNLGPVTVLWGAGDGKVVVTTSPTGFDALDGQDESLEDDDAFQAAREAAGVGEGDDVFAYLDLRELVQVVLTFAGFAGEEVPRDVEENLEPLDTFLLWGNLSTTDEVEIGAFLGIR
jgi:Protein of unknown function (DUF3352)